MQRLIVTAVLCCSFWQSVSADQSDSSGHTHLLYPRMGKLVLHHLAASDPTDATNIREVSTWDNMSRILDVFDGKIICVSRSAGTAFYIDLDTSRRHELAKFVDDAVVSHQHNCLIFTSPLGSVISQCDLTTCKITRLQIGNNDRPQIVGRAHNRLALSPDDQRVAAATYFKADDGILTHSFEISIIDLDGNPPTVRQLDHHFIGRNVTTGGGDHAVAPSMFWQDNGTLLLVAGKEEFAGATALRLDKPMTELVSINADTSQQEKICDLPFPLVSMMRFQDSVFWRRPDGPLMMRSSEHGDLRIDTKERSYEVDQHLTSRIRLQGDIWTPSLWAAGKQLVPKVWLGDVSVSPDGKQLVWLTPIHNHASAFSNASGVKKMWLQTGNGEPIEINEGRFSTRSGNKPASPTNHPTIRWLTEQDIKGSQ